MSPDDPVGSRVTRWSVGVLVALVAGGLLARMTGLTGRPYERWLELPYGTALQLTLLALAIVAIARGSRGARMAVVLAVAVAALIVALNALAIEVFPWPAGQELVAALGWSPTGQSAALHLLLGLALVAAWRGGRLWSAVRGVSLVVAMLGAAGALWGHVFGGAGVAFVPYLIPMSALVAAASLAAGVGLVAVDPDRWPLSALIASGAERRLVGTLLPLVLVVPTLGPAVATLAARAGAVAEVTQVIGPTITLAALIGFLALALRSHRRMVAEVAAGDAQMLRVLDRLPVAVMLRAQDGSLLHRNPGTERFLRRLGVDGDAVDAGPNRLMDHVEVVDEDGQPPDPQTLPVVSTLRDGRPHSATLGYALPDGSRAWYSARAAPVRLTDGTTGVVLTLDDVTERHEDRRRAAVAERSLRRTFDQAPIGIGVHAEGGRLVQVNRALCDLLGVDEATLLARGLPWVAAGPQGHGRPQAPSVGLMAGARSRDVEERRLRHADGRVLIVEVAAAEVRDDDSPVRLIVQVVDVTAQRVLQEELRLAAIQDPLTGVSNRRALAERLDDARKRSHRGGGDVGLLYLDLDEFKAVNDACGHEVGDRVLCDTAKRLLTATRETDTVCRLGGDEFVVLCTPIDGSAGLDELVARLAALPPVTVELGGRQIAVTGSVGAVLVEPGEDLDDVLRRADAAMYRVKRSATEGGVQARRGAPAVP